MRLFISARSGLSDIFQLYFKSCIFNKSLLSTKAKTLEQLTVENKELLPAKSLILDISPCAK